MKILKSKFHESEWYSGITKESYEVRVMPLDDCWPSVPICEERNNKPFRDNLRNDIEKDGLHFPLMLVITTVADARKQKKKYGKNMNEVPVDLHDDDMINVIWGGSQRYIAAIDLGYTHIDCAILPSLMVASKTQRLMRKPYRERYYQD